MSPTHEITEEAPVYTPESSPETQTTHRRKQLRPRRRTTIIPQICFARLVKQLSQDKHSKMIWSTKAIQTLQEFVELHVEKQFKLCNSLAELCKKNTITKEIFDFMQQCET